MRPSHEQAEVEGKRVLGNQPRIPTLLCFNESYVQHAAVCMVSLLENNRNSAFDFVVVTTKGLGREEEKLHRTLHQYENCTLRTIHFKNPDTHALPLRIHYSIDTYTRLWAEEFFPNDVERILYLDGDMVAVGDISDLWNTELGIALLGAVTIPGSTRCAPCGVPERFGYFQSGVLLINLKRWRQNRILARCLDWIGRHHEKIVDADQDVLNGCLYDRRYPLPFVWNVIAPFYFNYHPLGISSEELRSIRQKARIIHFNGPSKPWHYLSRHPRRAEYWKYLALTEWKDYVPPDRNFVNWGKKHVGPFVPERMRLLLKRAASST